MLLERAAAGELVKLKCVTSYNASVNGIKYVSRYYQLKVRHGGVGIFLYRIVIIEAPQCWWFMESVQSVVHLYTKCRKWRKEQRKLVRELEIERVTWQVQAERGRLAGLLANEKAEAPLLGF